MENSKRQELSKLLRSKIESKSYNRKTSLNKKKNSELQEKILNIQNILQSNSINSFDDFNNENVEILNEINSLLSTEDIKHLSYKLSDKPEFINMLKKIKQN